MVPAGERYIQFTKRLITVCCLGILICLSLVTQSAAELSVTKVSNWSCAVLPGSAFKVFPNALANEPVFLSRNGSMIRASQPNSDTPLFELPIPTGPYSLGDMTLGDFNHDGELEVALALVRTDRPDYSIRDSLVAEIHCIRLSDGTTINTLHWSVVQFESSGSGLELDRYWGRIRLDAIDFSHDGFADLRMWVQLETIETDYISFMYQRNDQEMGCTVWSHVPSTHMSGISGLSGEFWTLDDGQILGYYQSHASVTGNGSCCSPREGTASGFTIFNGVNHNVSFSFPAEPADCDDPCNGRCGRSVYNALLAHGTISPSYPTQQLLVSRSICNDCQCNSVTQLVTLDSNGATSLIWSRPPSDFSGYGNFVYSNTLHGYFMGMRADKKVYLFDGATGNFVSQSTESVPGNVVGWFDMFGDGEQYVLTQQDSTFSLYRVGLSVSVNEPDTEQDDRGNPEWLSCYPNPFNKKTRITVSLYRTDEIKIDIYDILGRHVTKLYEGPTVMPSGVVVDWDVKENASGTYFVRLEAKLHGTVTKKVTLLK